MDRKPQSHLINILKSTRDHHPNFVLMLGAGASKTSGIKLAGEMIEEWEKKLFEMYKKGNETIEKYLNKQNWYNTTDKYSILFEKLFDEPSQRREYIESCVKEATPSWGYIYLVNLIRKKVFNTVFTTNFDDLLNEACYLFSNEVRPIVCAHDSSINSIRITSERPKLIKLHGDFLFDNIKNTIRELETLEQNTQAKFKQYAAEFGFIVVGYSGNDRSIMDTFNTLLRFDQYFPNGIYWCIKKGNKITDKVDLLTRFPKFRIVEIEGFDEFFADIHNDLDLQLQPEMSDPYGSLVNRLNSLINKIKIPEEQKTHSVIKNDINKLGEKIYNITKDNNLKLDIGSSIMENLPIPYGLLSNINTRQGNYKNALIFRLKQLELNPSIDAFKEAFSLLIKSNDFKYIERLMTLYRDSKEIISKMPESTFEVAIILINAKKYDFADEVSQIGLDQYKRFGKRFDMNIYTINRILIKVLSDQKLTKSDVNDLEKIIENGDKQTEMGAKILLKKYEDAEKILLSLEKRAHISEVDMITWPIFNLLIPHLKNKGLKVIFAK